MEYFYSKYTGEELEERLDRIDDIPELLAEMLTGKNYTTPEDAMCIVKKYVPTIYENIPIDNNTIYWANTNDGKVLKARIILSDTDAEGECLWEKKTNTDGKEYLYSKLPVITAEGITMYADGEGLDIPSIYAGIPFDGVTIHFNNEGKVEVIGGTEGGVSNFWDLNDIPSWITIKKPTYSYSEIEGTPDLSNYVTKSYVDDNFVTFTLDEVITGIKSFTNGLKIGESSIKQLQEDVVYIDANLVVRGGVTMYYDGEIDIPNIKDQIGPAGYNEKGLASFDQTYFTINDGHVSLIEGAVGLNENELLNYLTNNQYATQSWVESKGFALNSDLTILSTKVNDFLEGSDTDNIINKWKELESFLNGLSQSDNLATILGTKADKSYVDSTFVTIKGNEDVIGIHNFTNGLQIGGVPIYHTTDDIIYLEGNLVIKGGVTMYALDDATVDSIIDKLPIASTTSKGIASFDVSYFTVDANGKVSIIPDSVGLNEVELDAYLTQYKYATHDWVTSQEYLTGIDSTMVVSALGFTPYNSASFTKANIKSTLGISDWALATSKPSYKTSEVTEETNLYFTNARAVAALKSITDGLATDIATKWTQDDNKIANWDTAYNWGDHSKNDYTTNAYVDKTFVTIGGTTEQIITGAKNFTGGIKVNGSPIYYDKDKKYWKLEGDLLVTGGVTMYGSDSSFTPSTIMDAIAVDGTTISKDGGILKVIGGTGGGISSVTSQMIVDALGYTPASATALSGYLPLSGGTLSNGTSNTPLTIKGIQDGSWISYTNQSNTHYGSMGFQSDNQPYVYHSNYGACKLWHSGNDGSGSGLDADLLDGVHLMGASGGFGIMQALPRNYTTANQFFGNGNIVIFDPAPTDVTGWGSHSTVLSLGNKETRNHQLIFSIYGGSPMPRYRRNIDGVWSDLKTFAFLDDNVASATKATQDGDGRVITDTYFSNRGASNSFDDKIYNGAYRTSSFKPNDAYGYGLVASFRSMETCAQIYFPDNNGEPQFRMQWNSQTGISRGWTGLVTAASIGNYNAGSATRIQAYAHDSGDKVLLSGTRSDNTYERSIYDNGWGLMLKRSLTNTVGYIATIDDNVASATKLQTARTIWGQSFDGTGNVDGKAKFTSWDSDGTALRFDNVYANKAVISMYTYQGNAYTFGQDTDRFFIGHNTYGSIFNIVNGNVGIGTTNPREKLEVSNYALIGGNIIVGGGAIGFNRNTYQGGRYDTKYQGWQIDIGNNTLNFYTEGSLGSGNKVKFDASGNILATGGVTMYSDSRKKTIINHVVLSLQQIANAPLIEHYYNSDQNKTTHVGSIAQYWAEMNDWFCKKDSEGYYTMEIQNAALASAISVARELVKFESETDRRIRLLEEENKRLKEEVEQLKWNIA